MMFIGSRQPCRSDPTPDAMYNGSHRPKRADGRCRLWRGWLSQLVLMPHGEVFARFAEPTSEELPPPFRPRTRACDDVHVRPSTTGNFEGAKFCHGRPSPLSACAETVPVRAHDVLALRDGRMRVASRGGRCDAVPTNTIAATATGSPLAKHVALTMTIHPPKRRPSA